MANPTIACMVNHCGLWVCEPVWLRRAVALVKAGAYPMVEAVGPSRERLYEVAADGTATIPIVGPMFKGGSKYSAASTLDVRRAVRAARVDPAVGGIMLLIDSPGGHVAGVQELADEVRATAKEKPVHAHIDDLGASAAYWVASQARRVTANATAEVGSIGVVAVVEDTSKAAELAGVQVHVVASGPEKAQLADGVPVTEEALDRVRELVAGLAAQFGEAVKRGRKMTSARLEAVSTGRVWLAGQALEERLIDAVESEDRAREGLAEAVGTVRTARKLRAGLDGARLDAVALGARRALVRSLRGQS